MLPARHLQIFLDRNDLLTLLTVQIITIILTIDRRLSYSRVSMFWWWSASLVQYCTGIHDWLVPCSLIEVCSSVHLLYLLLVREMKPTYCSFLVLVRQLVGPNRLFWEAEQDRKTNSVTCLIHCSRPSLELFCIAGPLSQQKDALKTCLSVMHLITGACTVPYNKCRAWQSQLILNSKIIESAPVTPVCIWDCKAKRCIPSVRNPDHGSHNLNILLHSWHPITGCMQMGNWAKNSTAQ